LALRGIEWVTLGSFRDDAPFSADFFRIDVGDFPAMPQGCADALEEAPLREPTSSQASPPLESFSAASATDGLASSGSTAAQ